MASARLRFSIGPLLDFRRLSSTLDIPGLPDEFTGDFSSHMQTAALGLGFHFDSRDNTLSPTTGTNAFLDGKFNREAFGSDREYDVYDLEAYNFRPLSP